MIPSLNDVNKAIVEIADREHLDKYFCLAVAKVESNCTPFLQNGYPLMRFEKHVFLRYIKRNHVNLLDKAVNLQGTLYDTYKEALEIHEETAIMATSFGLYQIMGFNHRYVGYETPKDFEEAMVQHYRNHIEAFIHFVKAHKLNNIINSQNFTKFATIYNGPNYAQYRYDEKLQKAYESAKQVGL